MLDALRKIYRDDGLRVATITLFFMGFAVATTLPYHRLIQLQ